MFVLIFFKSHLNRLIKPNNWFATIRFNIGAMVIVQRYSSQTKLNRFNGLENRIMSRPTKTPTPKKREPLLSRHLLWSPILEPRHEAPADCLSMTVYIELAIFWPRPSTTRSCARTKGYRAGPAQPHNFIGCVELKKYRVVPA